MRCVRGVCEVCVCPWPSIHIQEGMFQKLLTVFLTIATSLIKRTALEEGNPLLTTMHPRL